MRFRSASFRLPMIVAVLLATSVILPNSSFATISASGYDFGEIEIETTKTAALTITNQGQTQVEISGFVFAQSTCSSFSIAFEPESMAIPSNGTLEILVNFTPTELGICSDTLRIYTGTPVPSMATFFGFGIETVQSAIESSNLKTQYLKQIEAIKSFTQSSIEQGSLQGAGKGKWRNRRLKALTKKLALTSMMIENGNIEAAHNKLQEIYKKIDGKPQPRDSVEGDAKKTIAAEVHMLIEALKFNKKI